MIKPVKIACDSTTDLGKELLARYSVSVLPLGIQLGGVHYTDGVDMDPQGIYDHYAATGELPKTSAPNIGNFMDFFAAETADGSAVVFFTISSDMSSCYNNACVAAAEYEDVYVVDTRNLSTGGGLLVLAAAEMARAGKDAAEIAHTCEEMRERVDASFVIDSLEFLHKGGRCSGVAALGANLLQLKPCIAVREGKMGVGKKYRGKFAAVLHQYIADRLGDGSGIDRHRVFVTDAGVDPEIVRACVEQVEATGIFEEILTTKAGCTISSHCGQNCLGVLFVHTK